MDLYLIRHAEAAPGSADADDPGLSDRGRAQAARLAPRLAAAGVPEILHSPRRRAAETAALLAAAMPTAQPLRSAPSPLLDDRTPVPSASHRADYPARFLPWLDDTAADEADPDGTALTAAYAELTATPPHPRALVTHAFVIAWWVRHTLAAPPTSWLTLAPANASLTILRTHPDRPPTLIAFNDTGHLAPEPDQTS
jgi:serine/threonine-protein phosphatase PGAM5